MVLLTSYGSAEQSMKVTYQSFGVIGDGEKAQQFVDSIDATSEYSAKLLEDAHPKAGWRKMPKQFSAEAWISLVKVKIGAQRDFLAFTFADRQGTVAYAGHRPSRLRSVLYWYGVPPGPDQLPQNAIRECATDFLFKKEREVSESRKKVQVVVSPWSASDDEGDANDGGVEGALDAGGASDSVLDLTPLEALAFGASYEAGWQPTAARAKSKLTIELREDFSVFFSARLRLVDGEGERTLTRCRIPSEKLYPCLVRLCGQIKEQKSFTSFAFLGSHTRRLLAWHDGMALLKDGNSALALQPLTGKTLWKIKGAPRAATKLTVREGGKTILRYDKALSQIDWKTGETKPLATVIVDANTVAISNGKVAIVRDEKIEIYAGGKLLWTSDAARFVDQPVWSIGKLFVTNADGSIHAFDATSKKEVWNRKLTSGAAVQLFAVGNLVLADDGQAVHALKTSDGSLTWTHQSGDFLVGTPVQTEDGILLASKANKIWLVDASTGKAAAERSWSTWITSFHVSKNQPNTFVVGDLRNRITLLDTKTLKTRAEHTFQFKLRPVLQGAANVPLEWKVGKEKSNENDDFEAIVSGVKSVPAILCQDHEGFVYMVEIEK